MNRHPEDSFNSYPSPPKRHTETAATPPQNLSELDRTIKEAQDRLAQKKREFDFISKLDKKQVSKYLMGSDPEAIPNMLRKEPYMRDDDRIMSPGLGGSPGIRSPGVGSPRYQTKENISPTRNDWMHLPDRKANVVDLNKYMEKVKDDFYQPISQERIKILHADLKKQKAKFSLADIREDEEKLNQRYETKYGVMLKDQLRQEAERRRTQKYLTEMHEMRMILGQKVNINEPKIWKKDALTEVEKRKVREVFEAKIRSKEDKSLLFMIDPETDITRKIEAYMNSKYRDVNTDKEVKSIIQEKEADDKAEILRLAAAARSPTKKETLKK